MPLPSNGAEIDALKTVGKILLTCGAIVVVVIAGIALGIGMLVA